MHCESVLDSDLRSESWYDGAFWEKQHSRELLELLYYGCWT